MSNIIEIEHLSYRYEETAAYALADVSLSIPQGSYVALIGHNGSGKSTLAKAVAGLLSGYDGVIKVHDLELNKKTLSAIRQKTGLVFQNPDNQFVGSTVRDDIAFGLENHAVSPKEMDAIIEEYARKVGMENFLDTAPESLSGGQKQRVAIAGVLAMHPDLIIYDEATSMLDPLGKKEILDITLRLREENPNLTILSITHDIEEAAKADFVFVLQEGRLVLSGTPQEVFAKKEELQAIHMEPPFLVSLIAALKDEGVIVPDNINTLEELEEYLCR